ncbi:unnamed protein product [Parnassius apollo]|uniref:(apollo) hypothetical protein n=1 Tax=Parnassius apollo TaxID=110799 RepID=A0A8S3Y0E1_PARAO|nr:unnamed protein product [Parnassius apollo]
MHIRWLRYGGSYGIVGQVINVRVDSDKIVHQLTGQLDDDDQASNVNINHIEDSYNSSDIVTDTYSVAEDTLIGYKNLSESATNRQKFHKMSVVELGRLPYKIPNIDVEKDIVNGELMCVELLNVDKPFAELEAGCWL